MQVLERLPLVDIRWRHPQLVQARPKGLEEGSPPGQEYQLDVQLRRVGGKKGGSGLARVFAPRFPKVSQLAWVAQLLGVCHCSLQKSVRLLSGRLCTCCVMSA